VTLGGTARCTQTVTPPWGRTWWLAPAPTGARGDQRGFRTPAIGAGSVVLHDVSTRQHRGGIPAGWCSQSGVRIDPLAHLPRRMRKPRVIRNLDGAQSTRLEGRTSAVLQHCLRGWPPGVSLQEPARPPPRTAGSAKSSSSSRGCCQVIPPPPAASKTERAGAAGRLGFSRWPPARAVSHAGLEMNIEIDHIAAHRSHMSRKHVRSPRSWNRSGDLLAVPRAAPPIHAGASMALEMLAPEGAICCEDKRNASASRNQVGRD